MERLNHVRVIVVRRFDAIVHEINKIIRYRSMSAIQRRKSLKGRTRRENAHGLAEVSRLAIRTMRILQHGYHETKFTEQAVFSLAVGSNV